MYRLGLVILILIVPLLAPAGCSSNVNINESKSAPIVRVRIIENQERAIIASSGAPIFKSSSERTGRQIDLPGGTVPIVLAADGWHVGGVVLPAGELALQPASPGSVSVNGAFYRGRYRFVPTAANRFDVVNDVDVDSYLCGVLPSELLSGWHIEAYKAQAIAARTYALYEARTSGPGHAFDVDDDERSQVYKGLAVETAKSRQAAIETSGVVAAYGTPGNEKIFKAYFSSCCGGNGQSVYDAFGEPDIAPLRAKIVGNLCIESKKHDWGTFIVKKDELTRRFHVWGAVRSRPEKDIGLIQRVEIAPGAIHAGRPVRFLVTDARNLQYSMTGEELRTATNSGVPQGTPKLSSSFFTPVSTADSIQFTDGHGWGHGVGMCQWCINAMANSGKAHEDIVRFSYPGAVLVRAY